MGRRTERSNLTSARVFKDPRPKQNPVTAKQPRVQSSTRSTKTEGPSRATLEATGVLQQGGEETILSERMEMISFPEEDGLDEGINYITQPASSNPASSPKIITDSFGSGLTNPTKVQTDRQSEGKQPQGKNHGRGVGSVVRKEALTRDCSSEGSLRGPETAAAPKTQ